MFGLIFAGITFYKIIFKGSSLTSTNEAYEIPVNNYTSILNSVHEDIDTYINQKISFSGYVFRVYDLANNQFVLARDMIVSPDFQTLVVGFLCSCNNANEFKDGSWVKVTGTIKKGYYHGDIPIIEIESIEKIEKPQDEFVYPPDDFYIPTSSLLYNAS